MLRVTVSILYICSLNIQSHDIIKQNIFFIEFQFYDKYLFKSLIPVAMWSKVRVCSCSIAGIAASNPTEGTDVCFLYLLCLCVCVSNCLWSRNPNNEAASAQIGLLWHRRKWSFKSSNVTHDWSVELLGFVWRFGQDHKKFNAMCWELIDQESKPKSFFFSSFFCNCHLCVGYLVQDSVTCVAFLDFLLNVCFVCHHLFLPVISVFH